MCIFCFSFSFLWQHKPPAVTGTTPTLLLTLHVSTEGAIFITIMVDQWKKVSLAISFTGMVKEDVAESHAENLVLEIETSEEPVAPTLRYVW